MAETRLARARNVVSREENEYLPGDLVYAWRQGDRMRNNDKRSRLPRKRGVGPMSGQWYGPAVVLGTENVPQNQYDSPQPDCVVWVVINGRLWRCAPSQLRRASERERHAATTDETYPWTFHKIVRKLNQTRQFTDVVDEGEPHGESVELEHQDGVEFREEDDEQRRFEEEIMEDMLPGADTKDPHARSSSQVPRNHQKKRHGLYPGGWSKI